MPTPIDPKRLPGLKKALEQFNDEDMASQQQLAEIYGVTLARMTTLIKKRFPDFPPFTRHDDKTHWYPARAAVSSMIAYMQNSGAKAKAAAQRASAVLGRVKDAQVEAAEDAENQPQPLTASELDRLASAQTRIFRLKREQGLYTLTSEVQRIARAVNALISREVMNIVNVIDPNGELPPLQRQRLTNKCRDVVLKMHDEMRVFLEDVDDAGRASGTVGAGNGVGGDFRRRRVRPGGRDLAGAA